MLQVAVFSRVHKWFSQLEGYNVVVNFCRFQLMCVANVVGEALQALLLGVADLPSRVLPACLLRLLFIPLVHWRADDSMASRELFNRCVERDAACASIAVAARWQIPAAMITSQNNKLIRPTCGVVLLAFLHQQLSIRQQQPVYASHTSRWLQVCAQHRREDWRSALHFFRLLKQPTREDRIALLSSMQHCALLTQVLLNNARFIRGCPELRVSFRLARYNPPPNLWLSAVYMLQSATVVSDCCRLLAMQGLPRHWVTAIQYVTHLVVSPSGGTSLAALLADKHWVLSLCRSVSWEAALVVMEEASAKGTSLQLDNDAMAALRLTMSRPQFITV